MRWKVGALTTKTDEVEVFMGSKWIDRAELRWCRGFPLWYSLSMLSWTAVNKANSSALWIVDVRSQICHIHISGMTYRRLRALEHIFKCWRIGVWSKYLNRCHRHQL